jgi:hypothetical protein
MLPEGVQNEVPRNASAGDMRETSINPQKSTIPKVKNEESTILMSSDLQLKPNVAPAGHADKFVMTATSSSKDTEKYDRDERMSSIPMVNPIKLGSLYNPKTKNISGNLTKKGGSTGTGGIFSKRNWNKRLFVIETNIDETHNYTMKYYKENATKEQGMVPLAGTKVVVEPKAHSSADVGLVVTHIYFLN